MPYKKEILIIATKEKSFNFILNSLLSCKNFHPLTQKKVGTVMESKLMNLIFECMDRM